MIRSHSLHQANIVVVFPSGFIAPDNQTFTGIVDSQNAQGMNFVDNPVTQTKVISIPKLNIVAALEGRRLRVEDQSATIPEKTSPFISNAEHIIRTLSQDNAELIEGFGFNFDLYCQVDHVIDIKRLFGSIYKTGIDFDATLLDIGWQWTLVAPDAQVLDGYFVKVTAPLEISVHHNRHLKCASCPPAPVLQKEYFESYQKTLYDIEKIIV